MHVLSFCWQEYRGEDQNVMFLQIHCVIRHRDVRIRECISLLRSELPGNIGEVPQS